MNERRKYKRVAGRLRVIYKVEEEIAEASAYSIDISAGGFVWRWAGVWIPMPCLFFP